VNVAPNVIHTLNRGALLVESESARSLSSAFLHQALLHDIFIQTSGVGTDRQAFTNEMTQPGWLSLKGHAGVDCCALLSLRFDQEFPIK
jgi:hypothetical protein